VKLGGTHSISTGPVHPTAAATAATAASSASLALARPTQRFASRPRRLAQISQHLCGDAAKLGALVASDSAPSVLRVLHYDQLPDVGAQLEALPAGSSARAEATRRVLAAFPAHTDSGLLTLAPRGSCPGLSVKDYATGEWVDIEATLADNEVPA
jgi:isopenicillin N synthase-like dioxygenase